MVSWAGFGIRPSFLTIAGKHAPPHTLARPGPPVRPAGRGAARGPGPGARVVPPTGVRRGRPTVPAGGRVADRHVRPDGGGPVLRGGVSAVAPALSRGGGRLPAAD